MHRRAVGAYTIPTQHRVTGSIRKIDTGLNPKRRTKTPASAAPKAPIKLKMDAEKNGGAYRLYTGFAAGWARRLLTEPRLLCCGILKISISFFYGMRVPIVQQYVSEIAHAEIRGLLTSLHMMMLPIGTLIAYILGAFLKWSTLFWLCAGQSSQSLLCRIRKTFPLHRDCSGSISIRCFRTREPGLAMHAGQTWKSSGVVALLSRKRLSCWTRTSGYCRLYRGR